MAVLKMSDLELSNKRVLIREDLNAPVKNGEVTSDARLRACIPTIMLAKKANAATMLMSHLGRPTEGEYSEENSLAPVARRLSELLGFEVPLVKDYLDGVKVGPGQVVLCENVRFNKGEKKNDPELGKKYAALCDIFVMDAFATAHRAEASTSAVAEFAPKACAGLLLDAELNALRTSIVDAKRPLVAILGGSKVSTKLIVLETLCQRVDTMIVGGGIANNFLKAAGKEVGASLYEPDLVGEASRLVDIAKKHNATIPIPLDVVVAAKLSADSPAAVKDADAVSAADMILDIGPKTSAAYAEIIAQAGTIIWNGPVGAFEIDQFGNGTKAIAEAVANSKAFSLAGGGDTLAALDKYGLGDKISYLSTGGGAFLEFLEGKTLPAVEVLEKRAKG